MFFEHQSSYYRYHANDYFTILGSNDEVDTVEEQYLSEVYTPDFLEGLCASGESDEVNDKDESEENHNATDDCTTDERKNATSEKEPRQIVCFSYL